MTRRDAGWLVAQAAVVAGGQEFFSSWLSAAPAHEHSSAPPEPDRWSSYKPQFFSPEEFRMLDSFTARLIPTDDTPGAREAHVAHFIDFVVANAADYAPETQTQWRSAMDWLKANQFATMTPAQQRALIEHMAEPEVDRSKKHDGFPVYRLIKDITVHAYYTSRAGLVDNLEYKGNAYLAEFPGCKHPEHHKV